MSFRSNYLFCRLNQKLFTLNFYFDYGKYNHIIDTHQISPPANLDIDTQGIRIELYDSIYPIKDLWTSIVPNDVLFGVPFLSNIETYPPLDLKPLYAIVFHESTPIGLLYYQTKKIKLKENLRFNEDGYSVSTLLKKCVTGCINFQCTICGNTLLTGNYGLFFINGVSKSVQCDAVLKGHQKANQWINDHLSSPGLTVMKDYFADSFTFDDHINHGFSKFSVQPKMMVELDPKWLTTNDYIASIKSKYRVRNNKARSLIATLEKVELSLADIEANTDHLHSLYREVSDNAEFNAFILHQSYFLGLKQNLKDSVRFFAYKKNGVIIAFYTVIYNGDTLDAHFLGYSKVQNSEHQLYLNVLLDMVGLAIDRQMRWLDLSRTAVEIKSTIGAVPKDMHLYIRHEKPLLNKVTKKIVDFVKPSDEYIIRNPFKDEKE